MLIISKLLLAAVVSAGTLAQIAAVRPSERQLKWQQLELTAFFHYGMNTYTDMEWGTGKTPAATFNPGGPVDCNQWISAVKAAGFKLAILVAKHHDGFCLWPSKYTNYHADQDVVKSFTDACKKHGVKAGIYLSPWDMHEPSYGTDDYNIFFLNQLTELLSNYGPIDEVWFDGACGEGPNGKRQSYAWNAYYALIRKLQPQACIAVSGPDVRWVGNEGGFARDSEWSVIGTTGDENANDNEAIRKAFENYHFDGVDPAKMQSEIVRPAIDGRNKQLGSLEDLANYSHFVWFPAECDTSIRPGWFYHASQDNHVKSLAQLKNIYYSSVGRNSVLLLNIPPAKNGKLHPNDVQRLKEFGAFVKGTFENPVNPADGFNVIEVAEDIAKSGMLIERFHVEGKNASGEWENIPGAASTSVGYKRLIRLPEVVKYGDVRLVVDESRAEFEVVPTLKVYLEK